MTSKNTGDSLSAAIVAAAGRVQENQDAAALIAEIGRQGTAWISPAGGIFASTGAFTGRSPKDKFFVEDATTRNTVWWDNVAGMSVASFDLLRQDMLDALAGQEVFRQQLYAGAERSTGYQVEVFTPSAWHALFIRNVLIRPGQDDLSQFDADVTILHVPGFEADPARHGCRTSTCIALDVTRNIVLICGTFYAGEIKKAVFSLFNFHAPDSGILPMHCSANVGPAGDAALFFGLSGTGKTTLSSSPGRALIGDDEHGWNNQGIFNLEGGCYAKAVNLTEESEPEIYRAAQQFGSVHENVAVDAETGEPDYTDISATENTRIAYPLTAIENRVDSGLGPEPRNIVLLTADAFGVLPPISRLSHEQAVYYFLAGYTAKVAGTERGVVEPQATFSTCFGAPFMSRHPTVYARLLADRLARSGAKCWLLNTGWTGGPYGVGSRMKLKDTRRLLDAALAGELDDVAFRTETHFQLEVPEAVPGIDPRILDPRSTWPKPEGYDAAATKLVGMFEAAMTRIGVSADFAKSDAA